MARPGPPGFPVNSWKAIEILGTSVPKSHQNLDNLPCEDCDLMGLCAGTIGVF